MKILYTSFSTLGKLQNVPIYNNLNQRLLQEGTKWLVAHYSRGLELLSHKGEKAMTNKRGGKTNDNSLHTSICIY